MPRYAVKVLPESSAANPKPDPITVEVDAPFEPQAYDAAVIEMKRRGTPLALWLDTSCPQPVPVTIDVPDVGGGEGDRARVLLGGEAIYTSPPCVAAERARRLARAWCERDGGFAVTEPDATSEGSV